MKPLHNSYFDFTGKIALVTGGAGFLGTYFCRALADRGATVLIADTSIEAAQKLENEINLEASSTSKSFFLDVSDEANVTQVFETISKEYGHIDVLFNNAASKSKSLKAFLRILKNYSMDT
ncbi:MAG: SDR family NAD(P)-dependent oxidoreductase [Bdellovibrionota bacterium]